MIAAVVSCPDVAFQYDWLNRLTNMVDAAGTTKYTYTAGNQLRTEDGPFASDTVTNGYLNRLRVSLSLQQPTGVWTNGFAYDAARRLTNVVSPAGTSTYTLAATAGASPLPKKLLLPNGAYITNTYDNVARLLTNALKNSSGTVLDSYAYLYNLASQRTNLTRADASTVGYRYDNIGQLKVADSSVNTEDRGYAYDAAWNLHYRTNNGAVSTFTVDTNNQLTFVTGTPARLTYDTNGNLITSHDGHQVRTYDDENRLVRWVLYNCTDMHECTGDERTDWAYDGLGRMRQRTEYVYSDDDSAWLVAAQVSYIYDGNRVIQERNGTNNAPTVSYTRGSDLSHSLEGAGGIGGLLARSEYNGSGGRTNHAYYFAEGNGNVTCMIDSSQAMVASYRYDPFGNTISSSGSLADINVYRFSSKEIHVSSGMY